MEIKASPWKTGAAEEPCSSLKEIMSEQLVDDLYRQEYDVVSPTEAEQFVPRSSTLEDFVVASCSGEQVLPECADDETLARMLQTQFDREHNRLLHREQDCFNRDNKVAITYERYRAEVYGSDSDSDSLDDDLLEQDITTKYTPKSPSFNSSGLTKQDGVIISKHDRVVSGRQNSAKMLMKFPPEFQTGDGAQMDLKLPNAVYNKLKTHSIAEQRRAHRHQDKREQSTAELAVDTRTRLILFKMVNSGLLESISGSIATGKEANVLHAFGGRCPDVDVPAECAVKVFKTALSEFKNRKEYVDSFRFKSAGKVMKIWAEKEKLNLTRMRRRDIPCPRVVKLRKHVLVMSFIGADGRAAPQLREAPLELVDWEIAYDQVCNIMQRMYSECRLVHADLSEFNLLWWQDQVYVIDVGQAVDTSHEKIPDFQALVFLARDCITITGFFSTKGVVVRTPWELFQDVTGLPIECDDVDGFRYKVEEFSVDNRNAEQFRDKRYQGEANLRRNLEDESLPFN